MSHRRPVIQVPASSLTIDASLVLGMPPMCLQHGENGRCISLAHMRKRHGCSDNHSADADVQVLQAHQICRLAASMSKLMRRLWPHVGSLGLADL